MNKRGLFAIAVAGMAAGGGVIYVVNTRPASPGPAPEPEADTASAITAPPQVPLVPPPPPSNTDTHVDEHAALKNPDGSWRYTNHLAESTSP